MLILATIIPELFSQNKIDFTYTNYNAGICEGVNQLKES